MRKLVEIEKIYTDNFGETILVSENPFIELAREIIENPKLRPDQTLYYGWLLKKLSKEGIVFGYITGKELAINEVERFRGLAQSIKERGYDNKYSQPLVVIEGKIYGELMAIEWGENYKLYDGLHSVSILYVLGKRKVPLTICT